MESNCYTNSYEKTHFFFSSEEPAGEYLDLNLGTLADPDVEIAPFLRISDQAETPPVVPAVFRTHLGIEPIQLRSVTKLLLEYLKSLGRNSTMAICISYYIVLLSKELREVNELVTQSCTMTN